MSEMALITGKKREKGKLGRKPGQKEKKKGKKDQAEGMGPKGNQNSATTPGNGTTEGQSVGKAVLGSAEDKIRQRGTTELCQNAVAQRPSLYSTKT